MRPVIIPSIHWSNTFLLSTIFFSISFSFRSVSFLSFAMVFSRSYFLSFAMVFSRSLFISAIFRSVSFLLSAIVSFNPMISPLLAAAEKSQFISCSFWFFFRIFKTRARNKLVVFGCYSFIHLCCCFF